MDQSTVNELAGVAVTALRLYLVWAVIVGALVIGIFVWVIRGMRKMDREFDDFGRFSGRRR